MVGEGWMFRGNGWLWSAELSAEIGIPITKWLNIIVLMTETQRQDLKRYGDEWRFNLGAGFEIDINTKY